eukprot:221481-Pelagomonas_calceolata.AAC.1
MHPTVIPPLHGDLLMVIPHRIAMRKSPWDEGTRRDVDVEGRVFDNESRCGRGVQRLVYSILLWDDALATSLVVGEGLVSERGKAGLRALLVDIQQRWRCRQKWCTWPIDHLRNMGPSA